MVTEFPFETNDKSSVRQVNISSLILFIENNFRNKKHKKHVAISLNGQFYLEGQLTEKMNMFVRLLYLDAKMEKFTIFKN